MAFVGFWLVCGLAAAVVANSKGRSFFGWLFLGILLGPFALFMVGFMPALSVRTRRCPHCAEFVMPQAKVCKHCGRDLPAPSADEDPAKPTKGTVGTATAAMVLGVLCLMGYGGYSAYQEFFTPPKQQAAPVRPATAPDPWQKVSSLEVGDKTIYVQTKFDDVLAVLPNGSMTTATVKPDPDIEGSDIVEQTFSLGEGKQVRFIAGRWDSAKGPYRVRAIYVTR